MYIGSAGGDDTVDNQVDKPRKIDVLLISHRFDDECIYITIPEIFEKHSIALGAGGAAAANMFHREFVLMLDEIAKLLTKNSSD